MSAVSVTESLGMTFFYFSKFVEFSPLSSLLKFALRKFNDIVIGNLLPKLETSAV